MSKTICAVIALGGMGCVLLSLLMKQVLQIEHEHLRNPLETQLEAVLATHLAGPVRVREEHEGAMLRVVANFPIVDGCDRGSFAEVAGGEVWRSLYDAPVQPQEVLVVVGDAAGTTLLSRRVARPALARRFLR